MKDRNFDLYSRYYDFLYQEKDYPGEADYVYNKLKSKILDFRSVLELGMGTGIHAGLLKAKGLQVTGIELSEEMAKKAREKGIECAVGSSVEFNLNKQFDSIISLFHVISYITENEKLIKTFQNVHNHLKTNGIFLFDIWYSPAVYTLKPEIRIKRIENNEIKVTRIAEPVMHHNQNTVYVNYEILVEESKSKISTRIQETHQMRHFSLPEIQLLASVTGFEILETEEWMTGKKPSENTWGVCFTLRKVKK